MTQTIQANAINLGQLETKFKIQLIEDEQFFREWQDDLPEINREDKQKLDRVKASYSYLLKYPPILENSVKMVVLSPLLDLAGFYLPPLRIRSEESIRISAEDEGTIVQGKIDVLVVYDRFWIVIIESKNAGFSLEVGRLQLLAYMLANPNSQQPTYGLIMNGVSFRFLKLVKSEYSQYSVSRVFDLFNPGNDLYEVLKILKRLARLYIPE